MFLDISNGTRVSNETNDTEFNISSLQPLQPDVNYTAFVVAYGGDLPSELVNIVILQGKYTLSVFLLMFIKQLCLLR